MATLGWLVIESTTRDGCETDGTQQFWARDDAEAEADRLRSGRDDPEYTVDIRRETTEDADRYGQYI